MGKCLVLLAGYPATGKSYLMARLVERHPGELSIATPDDIKERVWDEVGFDDAEEKATLEQEVWQRYYMEMDAHMARGGHVLSDYPFSEKQRPTLAELIARHGYHALTVRLVGDPETLYTRSYMRDLSQARHLGHLVSRYHKGDVLKDRSTADALVDKETFLTRCRTKGYDRFCLGDLIEVDATDVSSIDYKALLDKIDAALVA